MRPSEGPATAGHTERLLRLAAVMVAIALAGGMLFATMAGVRAQGPQSGSGASAKARYWHTATRLDDGNVLVVGGRGLDGPELRSAELYDPATQDFTRVGSLAEGRSFHTATLLADGRVLVVGGHGDDHLSSAELYDPSTQLFTTVGSLATRRVVHTATLLADGRVLIVGGLHEDRTATVELYDPSAIPSAEEAKSLSEPLPEPTPAPIVGAVYSRGTVGLSLDGVDAAKEARAIWRLVDGGQRVQSVVADRRIRLGGVWVTLELRLRKDGPRLRLPTSPDIEPQTIYRSDEATRIETTLDPDGSASIRFEGLRLRKGKSLDLPGRARSLDGSVTWSCFPPPELGGPQAEGDPDPDDRGGLSGHVTMSSVPGGATIAALDLTGACDDPDHGFSFWSKALAWPDGRTVIVQLQNMQGDMYVSLAPSGSKSDVIAAGAVAESIVADWPDFAVEGRLKTVDGNVLVTGAWRCG